MRFLVILHHLLHVRVTYTNYTIMAFLRRVPESNRRISVLSRTLLCELVRLGRESNPCIEVLQTPALPLRHRANM